MFTLLADGVLIFIFLLIAAVGCHLIWQVLFRPDKLIDRSELQIRDRHSLSAETTIPTSRHTGSEEPLARPARGPADAGPVVPTSTSHGAAPQTIDEDAPLIFLSHFAVEVAGDEIMIFPVWKNGSMQEAAVVLSQSAAWNAYPSAPLHSFGARDLGSAKAGPFLGTEQSKLTRAQETQQYQAISIPASTIEAVRSGRQHLIISGRIEYEDYPEQKKRRKSEFIREMVIVESAIDDQGTTQVSAVFRDIDLHNAPTSLEQPVKDVVSAR